jgi:hypothetical protein
MNAAIQAIEALPAIDGAVVKLRMEELNKWNTSVPVGNRLL